jgi:hypothetical protein
MLYEIATLNVRLGGAGTALEGIAASVAEPAAKGTLLGVWTTEIGELNQILVLRGFEGEADLRAERRRQQDAANVFSGGDAVIDGTFDSYAPFPFRPPVAPGKFGAVYEIRTYRIKPGCVSATIAAWEAAMPEREKFSPLAFVGVALDGPARFTHIWPYASMNDRLAIRAETVAKGVWPPKGGPACLTGDMRSIIALPAAISPLG